MKGNTTNNTYHYVFDIEDQTNPLENSDKGIIFKDWKEKDGVHHNTLMEVNIVKLSEILGVSYDEAHKVAVATAKCIWRFKTWESKSQPVVMKLEQKSPLGNC